MSWTFVSTGWLAYFDSWYVGGMLVLTFSRYRWAIAITTLVCPWVDERYLLAVPLSLLLRWYHIDCSGRPILFKAMIFDALTVAICSSPYLLIRLFAYWTKSDAKTELYVIEHLALLQTPYTLRIWGAWEGLRFGWIGVAILVGTVKQHSQLQRWWLLPVVLLLSAIGSSFIAADISRSICLIVPAAVVGLQLIAGSKRRFIGLLLALAGLTLIVPARHVIIGFSVQNLILYLPSQLWKFHEMPDATDPIKHNQLGNVYRNQGNLARALVAFDDAIKLDPRSAYAYINRASVHADLNHFSNAIDDFQMGIRLGKNDPEVEKIKTEIQTQIRLLRELDSK